jgi:hypothetical protein
MKHVHYVTGDDDQTAKNAYHRHDKGWYYDIVFKCEGEFDSYWVGPYESEELAIAAYKDWLENGDKSVNSLVKGDNSV